MSRAKSCFLYVLMLMLSVGQCNVLAAGNGAAANQARTSTLRPAPRTMTLEQAQSIVPGLSSVEQLKLISRFVRAARYREARQLLSLTSPKTVQDEVFKKYLLARILYGHGDSESAIRNLREIVNIAPKFSQARLTLAKMLYETKQDQSAKHHFQLLQGESVNQPGLGHEISSYINSIDQRKKISLSAYLSLAPSTNINNGTDSRVIYVNGIPFVIDEDNRAKSGVGLAFGAQAGYRQPITDRLDIITSVGLDAKVYKKSDFNVATASLSVGPKLHFNWGAVGAFVIGSLGYSDNQSNNKALGGLLTLQAKLGQRNILTASAQCMNRSFSKDFNGDDLSYQDGYSCFAGGRIERFLVGGRAVRITAGAGLQDSELEHLKYNQWRVGAGVYGNLPYGFVADLRVNYARRDYDGIAPGASFEREDNQWQAGIQLLKPSWNFKGFTPQINYTYTNKNSNVDFYDYDSHGINLTLTKDF